MCRLQHELLFGQVGIHQQRKKERKKEKGITGATVLLGE
jgi:hypothetical protein